MSRYDFDPLNQSEVYVARKEHQMQMAALAHSARQARWAQRLGTREDRAATKQAGRGRARLKYRLAGALAGLPIG